jgi:Na+/H+ antiporter NhaD/arsenite permease-like protein
MRRRSESAVAATDRDTVAAAGRCGDVCFPSSSTKGNGTEMEISQAVRGSGKGVVGAIAVVAIVYVATLVAGWPQAATEMANQETAERAAAQEKPREGHAAAVETVQHAHPPLWTVLPFALLLLGIAVLPLIPWTEHWWDNNLHRFYVAGGLGLLTLLYYLVLHEMPVEMHWPGSVLVQPSEGPNHLTTGAVLVNAILGEYVPFIVLLFTLYTITGGIRIEGDLRARPLTNSCFLATGAVLASFIGTTGAAMLLIRPLLETNSERKHVVHTVIMFIFVVCNCGGCLLPLGDPPLFLGYLRGVPFLWTVSLWKEWLFVNGALIAIYFLWDHLWFYPHEEIRDIARDETQIRGLRFSGLWPNALLLVGVILSVGLLDPAKAFPGTSWHPWMYLREVVQLGLVGISLLLGSDLVRKANNFNYAAIVEVAALFFGIFVCMQAPLQILHVEGPNLGLTKPAHFFWATGSLSSVLDNAPTYVVFFETAKTIETEVSAADRVAGVDPFLLTGVSLGAVFMGSMTYIGNGPNFMVKAIAEKSGIRMPSFFGYVVYSCVILLPLLALSVFLFL